MSLIRWFGDRKEDAQKIGGAVLRGASRTIDQVNPYDGGRTWQQRTPTTNQSVKQQAVQQIRNTGTGTGLRGVRAGIGAAQGLSGLYDLASPGTGTNRFSKQLDSYGKFVDQTAVNEGVNTPYNVSALPVELLMFRGGASATNQGLKRGPQIVRRGAQAYDRGLGKVADRIAKGSGPIGKGTAYGVRKGLTADQMLFDAAMESKYIGEDASKGIEITPQRLLAEAGLSIGGGIGGQLIVDGLTRGIRQATPAVKKTAQTANNNLNTNRLKERIAGIGAERTENLRTRQIAASRGDWRSVDQLAKRNIELNKLENRLKKQLSIQEKQLGLSLKVTYPDAKDLPKQVIDGLPKTRAIESKVEAGKLPETVGRASLTDGNSVVTRSNLKTIAKAYPEFKDNPVFEFKKGGLNTPYGAKDALVWEAKGKRMVVSADSAIAKNDPQIADILAKAQDGEQFDFSDALKPGSNSVPIADDVRLGQRLPGTEVVEQINKTPKKVSDPLDSLKAEARKYDKWTDFVNDNVGDNKSILNPKRKELRALWEDANSELVAKRNAEIIAKRTARAEASKRASSGQSDKFGGYGMSHRPSNEAPGHKLNSIVKDIYDKPQNYRTGDAVADAESVAAIKKIRNNPDAEVTIYRAGPKNEFNDGDWISLSKKYAQGEAKAESVPVHSKTVKASEIGWPGDSINEFGYFPKKATSPTKAPAKPLDSLKAEATLPDGYELPSGLKNRGVVGVTSLGNDRFDLKLNNGQTLKDVLINKSIGEKVDNLSLLKDTTDSRIAYGGKTVETSGDFKLDAQRVRDNLKAGEIGYVRTKDGKTYEISGDRARAKLITQPPKTEGVAPTVDSDIAKSLKKGDTITHSTNNGQFVQQHEGKLKRAWVDNNGNGWVSVSYGKNQGGQEIVNKFPLNQTDQYNQAQKAYNKGLGELSNIRKQYANDQEFFDKVILENQDAKGEIGDFARHIARRDATEGSIYNKNYLTEILDDELAPINSKLDQAVAKTAQRDELAKTVRDFEKSTGQTGLYKKVAEAMRGMNEQEQIDFMGKALKDMRDNGLMAADYLNKQSGYTPKPKPTTPPKGVAPTQKTPRVVYRGGKPFDKKLVGSDGTSFSTDKAIADRWRGSYKGGVTEEFQLAPDAKVFTAPKPEVPLGRLTDSDKFAVVADASRKGYDAVDMTSWGEKEVRVINADKLTQSAPPKGVVPKTPPIEKTPTKAPDQTASVKAAKKQAAETEKLKKAGKIKPNDQGYWTTPVKGQPKQPIPKIKDTSGRIVKEGDVIEFDGALGGQGRATVQWQEPHIANASGKLQPGQWIGNGPIDSGKPFRIVSRRGEAPAKSSQKALEAKTVSKGMATRKTQTPSPTNKPLKVVQSKTKPLSQPETSKATPAKPEARKVSQKQVGQANRSSSSIVQQEVQEVKKITVQKPRSTSTKIGVQNPKIANRIMPDGRKVPAIRDSGIYAPKEFETFKFNDVKGQTYNINDAVLAFDGVTAKKAGKQGFGPTAKLQFEESAAIGYKTNYASEKGGMITATANKHGVKINEKTGRQLFDALEGRDAPANVKALATDLRNVLDGMRIEANKVRKQLGKKEIGYIKDYAPHLQRVDHWRKMWADPKTTISENFDYIVPNAKKNPHAIARKGGMKDIETNGWKLLDAYTDAISSDIFTAPSIERWKAVNSVLKGREYYGMSNIIEQHIREQLTSRPAWIDAKWLTRGGKGEAVLQKWNAARNVSALAGNVVWTAFVQPASLALTTARVGGLTRGTQNVIRGMFDFATNKAIRKDINQLPTMISKRGNASVGTTGGGDLDRIAGRIFKSKTDKWNGFVGKIADGMEYWLTGTSMAAGRREGIKLGMKGDDLKIFMDWAGGATQSRYNREARPMLLNNLTVRSAAPFQTYAFEMWRYGKTLVTGKKGGMPLEVSDRLSQATMLLAGMYLYNQYSEATTGRTLNSPGSMIPLVGGQVDDIVNRGLSAVGLQERDFGGGRSPIATQEDINSFINAVDAYAKHGNMDPMRKQLVRWGMGFTNVAGAGTLNRFIDGMIANVQGYHTTRSGLVAYPVSGTDKLIAPVLGPGSTSAGKAYKDGGFQNLGEKQSETFKNKPESARQSYFESLRGSDGKKVQTSSDEKADILRAGFNTPEGKEYLSLDSTERKNHPLHSQYLAMKRAFETQDHPEGLSSEYKKVLDKDLRMTDEGRTRMQYSQSDYDYNLAKAKYERDMKLGKLNRVDQLKKGETLFGMEVRSTFPKDVREVYSMSEDRINKYLDSNQVDEKFIDNLLALEEAELKNGLRKTRKLTASGSGKSRTVRGRSGGSGGKAKKLTQAEISKYLQAVKGGAYIKAPQAAPMPRQTATPQFRVQRRITRPTGSARTTVKKGMQLA
jgi:hypothetical protein